MKNITKIIRISKPLYGLVAIIATLIVVTALIDLIVPLFSKYIVDEIIASIQHKGGSISHLTVLISASFALGVFGIILTAITERLGDHFAGELRKFQ
jgi:ABC-type bacteriocin/lantibiotic exporter with double-glycine peptidase domain